MPRGTRRPIFLWNLALRRNRSNRNKPTLWKWRLVPTQFEANFTFLSHTILRRYRVNRNIGHYATDAYAVRQKKIRAKKNQVCQCKIKRPCDSRSGRKNFQSEMGYYSSSPSSNSSSVVSISERRMLAEPPRMACPILYVRWVCP